MDKNEHGEEIDMAIKAPKSTLRIPSAKEIRSKVKVTKLKTGKDGTILLDRNNPDHVRFWED